MRKSSIIFFLVIISLYLCGCGLPTKKIQRYKDGAVFAEVTYVKDVRHGKFRYYYKNGNPKKSGVFKNNSFDGPITFYYDSGRVQKVTKYKNGIRHGAEIKYYKFGEIRARKEYEDGKLIKEREYDIDGNMTFFREYPYHRSDD
jgi:antitoxin component YwqK of YwqJK toxin-antitoxin module